MREGSANASCPRKSKLSLGRCMVVREVIKYFVQEVWVGENLLRGVLDHGVYNGFASMESVWHWQRLVLQALVNFLKSDAQLRPRLSSQAR